MQQTADGLEPKLSGTPMLDGYTTGGEFCEVFDGDRARDHDVELVARPRERDAADLAERAALIADTFRNLGITFAVYGEDEGIERTWPLDLAPRIITAREWRTAEDGPIQRVRALNAFPEDLHVGNRTAFEAEVIPPWP